jgi:hypothetical protein
VPGVAGFPHDQEKRGTGASDLVVKLGAVDLKTVISLCDRPLSISRLSWALEPRLNRPREAPATDDVERGIHPALLLSQALPKRGTGRKGVHTAMTVPD